ncbi:MAG TPA: signal recognition particle-docking protein FtsY, partial [Methanomicrobia archaeon]|nr:signal recognition particle-docking protein FtsY [Methanomicrobia archaeon]HEX58582.1 signal recognition particle-docking protein FtsY [Methanomicrobia archaeon]
MFERLKQKFREFTKSIEKKVQEVKTVVTEGEVILDSKDLEEPLEELEFALLESDVALPVAESIIEAVRNELIGRRKKLLKSTEVVVRDALREALLKTLFPYEFDFDEFVERCE